MANKEAQLGDWRYYRDKCKDLQAQVERQRKAYHNIEETHTKSKAMQDLKISELQAQVAELRGTIKAYLRVHAVACCCVACEDMIAKAKEGNRS